MNNRLVGKILDPDGEGEEDPTEEYYAYDQTPFSTRENASQILFRFEGSELSDLKSRYLWAPVVDLLLSDEKLTGPSTPGDVYWTLGDNLNTVRDIARYDPQTDTTTIVNHRVFDAFGNITSESNSAVDLIFAFTGRLFDESTGLQNNLNRWYDPTIGRWLSEDPIGFRAADANLCRYVNNAPTFATDPRGLRSAAARWEYVPGAVTITRAGPSAPYGATSIGSIVLFTATPQVSSFWSAGRAGGVPLATSIGWVQIKKCQFEATSANLVTKWWESVYNYDWQIDGGVPYKGHSTNPSARLRPTQEDGGPVNLSDTPGVSLWPWGSGGSSYARGFTVKYLRQDFESHVVCLSSGGGGGGSGGGDERGAVYGGYSWGHEFRLKPGRTGQAITDYTVFRWCNELAYPSVKFRSEVGARWFGQHR